MSGDQDQAREQAHLLQRVRLTAVIGLVSALLALGTGAVTLVFDLKPEWKPDPKAQVGAAIKVRALDLNVTQGQFLARIHASRKGCTKDQLARQGNVVYIEADIRGFKRSATSLRWFTYLANGVRLPYLRSSDSESTIFRPQAPINAQLAEVWVPTSKNTGSYFIRFELTNGRPPNEVLLGFRDTQKFRVEHSAFAPYVVPCNVKASH